MQKINWKGKNKNIRITTNATLLTDEIIDYLIFNNFFCHGQS